MSHAVDPEDEHPHPPGGEELWSESYYADFVSEDGSLGGYVRLGVYPNLGVSWWTAMIVSPGRPLVAWTDYHLPVPAPGPAEGTGLALQARGLDLSCDAPAPLEAFAVRAVGTAEEHDRPEDVYERRPGRSVEVALDLTWRTDGSPYHYLLTTRYEIPCLVEGRLRLDGDELPLAGSGQRDHSWGVRDWWSLGWCWASVRLGDGTRIHTTDVRVPGSPAFGYVQSGGAVRPVTGLAVGEELGEHGFPRSAHIEVDPGGLELTVTPLAFGPLLLEATDGRLSRFPRALARFDAADGRSGLGWIEWNQPQPQ